MSEIKIRFLLPNLNRSLGKVVITPNLFFDEILCFLVRVVIFGGILLFREETLLPHFLSFASASQESQISNGSLYSLNRMLMLRGRRLQQGFFIISSWLTQLSQMRFWEVSACSESMIQVLGCCCCLGYSIGIHL